MCVFYISIIMKRNIRKFFEAVVEKILLASGAVTSVTILLIILFLFREGSGLFRTPIVEGGYSLIVNSSNRVTNLEPQQIKDIFDAKIENWSQVGGADEPILVFRLNDIVNYASAEEIGEDFSGMAAVLGRVIEENKNIIAFVPTEYLPAQYDGRNIAEEDITPSEFFMGEEWFPTAQPAPLFGVLPLIWGTLWVSLAAILFALPFAMAAAIYIGEIAHPRIRKILKPLFELLAGIPSVVYGFFGLVVIVPLVQQLFGLPVGETALSGAIILAIMALPTIITVAEDSIRNVPRAAREASLALGASKWQTIWRVVLPYGISGIMAGVVLGIGRAIGETMAVLMVTGNAAVIPTTLLEPVRTIPATIAAELGEAPAGGAHYQALFMLGVILFLITLVISILAEFFASKRPKPQI
ncbi:Phosphate transport system permease protein PstC [Mucinivorans hirudinis]|uniref:Phosphate transport system permease protein n=1 Tax=Mucinivorans hirudinis TaxID=1433126 RepID=A0A060R9M8_9BACT|nr:Phosphate transport system permease protein PstC [Mucinivorans hirudinis]